MQEALQMLAAQAKAAIASADSSAVLEQLRVSYLGKKGELTAILRGLKDLAPEARAQFGALSNQVKQDIEAQIVGKSSALEESKYSKLATTEALDVTKTLPAAKSGHLHPITQTWMLIEDIFNRIGFEVASGPEVEWDKFNFELLNMPKDHPARDTQDTFYVSDEILLRTQTSPVQIRWMQNHQPPVRIIAPGRVFRRDYDLTHTPMFHQFEGLVVDKGITIQDLKGTCIYAMQSLLGSSTKVRFRPHNFPFTEPSLEVDASCNICQGKGCRTCKHQGWLEMAGAGMVHPQVLRNVGYDPEQVSGFAFGFGIDRIAMMRFGISDLRLLFEGDMRFLQQF